MYDFNQTRETVIEVKHLNIIKMLRNYTIFIDFSLKTAGYMLSGGIHYNNVNSKILTGHWRLYYDT